MRKKVLLWIATVSIIAMVGVVIAGRHPQWIDRTNREPPVIESLETPVLATPEQVAVVPLTATPVPPTPTTTATPVPATLTATATAAPSTHTPTATLTATAAPEERTPTPTHTATPIPDTPAPTARVVATAIPASKPTPAQRWLPAPSPIRPEHGAEFDGWRAAVDLVWEDVPGRAEDEYYVVRIPYALDGSVAEFWRSETTMQVPRHFSYQTVGFANRRYDWTVQVMRCIKNCDQVLDDSVEKTGIAVGQESGPRTFYWYPDVGTRPTPTDWPPKH